MKDIHTHRHTDTYTRQLPYAPGLRPPRHNDHRNKQKCGAAHYPGICMAVAVILNERSQKMAGIQSLVSMILFASHAEKQVKIKKLVRSIIVCMS